MIFLVAAVVLIGLLCLFDLLLTFAVLRRLREHTAELGRLGAQPTFTAYDPQVLVGIKAPDLAAESGTRLVAFFDADCEACHEHAPEFAGTVARAFDNVLAVVSGKGREAEELLAVVGPDIPVVREAAARALVQSVGLKAFPTFLLVQADGTITQAVNEPGELTQPVPTA
ncbi:hypothetical protein ACWDSL_00100 [Streptomyces sp. NPDC000941]